MKIPDPSIPRRGFMLVISSPSGVGKTTIAHHILDNDENIELSISVTTRPKRPSEVEGEDYHFVNEETFQEMISKGMLLEHAWVYGYHYGTPKASIEDHLSKGIDALFDIDWQGTQQLKQISTGDIVTVFLLPPTISALEKRLRARGQDSEETIQLRMSKANTEMSHWAEYDYIVINNSLEESIESLRSIIKAERLKRRRRHGLAEFVNGLRDEI